MGKHQEHHLGLKTPQTRQHGFPRHSTLIQHRDLRRAIRNSPIKHRTIQPHTNNLKTVVLLQDLRKATNHELLKLAHHNPHRPRSLARPKQPRIT